MLEKLSWLFGCLCSFCTVLLFRQQSVEAAGPENPGWQVVVIVV